MKAPGSLARSEVNNRLLERAWEFDFSRAAWLIERQCAAAVPVGGRGPLANEALRFRPDLELGFPPTDVRRVAERVPDKHSPPYYRMDITFLGLFGVSTPLPLHYAVRILRLCGAELAAPAPASSPTSSPTPTPDAMPDASETVAGERGENAARELLDVIHHRLISLFYRAGLKYRYHLTFGFAGRDRITDYLLRLVGAQPGWGRPDLGVPPLRLLRYAGSLTQRPRSATQLRGILADYWPGIEVRVEQMVGRWVMLAADEMNRIGESHSGMGVDLTVGDRVFDLGGAFRIVLGPVDWDEYMSFMPSGERYGETKSLVRYYCTDPLVFSLEIQLRPGVIPPSRLGSGDEACRLGHTSWLNTGASPATAVEFE